MIFYTSFTVRYQYTLIGRITVDGYPGQFEVRYRPDGGNKCDVIVLHECWRNDTTARKFRPLLVLQFDNSGEGRCIEQLIDSGFEFLDIEALRDRATQILNLSCCHTKRLTH